jgi:hypothetical protein
VRPDESAAAALGVVHGVPHSVLNGRLFLPDGLNTTRLRADAQLTKACLIVTSQKDEFYGEEQKPTDERGRPLTYSGEGPSWEG